MYWMTLQPVPIVRDILSQIFYLVHPMEVDAKIKKWVYAGFVFNLDCDTGWARYNGLVVFTAVQQLRGEGVRYEFYDPYTTLAYLNSDKELDNPVFKRAKKFKGHVVRLPYEQKMVYAPWVKGVMRDKKELPWFTRTFLFWVEGYE